MEFYGRSVASLGRCQRLGRLPSTRDGGNHEGRTTRLAVALAIAIVTSFHSMRRRSPTSPCISIQKTSRHRFATGSGRSIMPLHSTTSSIGRSIGRSGGGCRCARPSMACGITNVSTTPSPVTRPQLRSGRMPIPAAVHGMAAMPRSSGATPITSSTGRRVAARISTIWSSCAEGTTPPSTRAGHRSADQRQCPAQMYEE